LHGRLYSNIFTQKPIILGKENGHGIQKFIISTGKIKENNSVHYLIQIYNTEFIGFERNDNGFHRFLKNQTHLQFYDGWEIQITSQLST